MGKLVTLGACGIFIGAVLVATVGVIGWVVLPKIVDDGIKDVTRLTNANTRHKWQYIKIPFRLQFYIFNCTNPEALASGEKLRFKELGPYVYTEKRSKDVQMSEDKQTARYRETSVFFFNPNQTKGSLDDVVYIPNVPFISLAHVGFATKTGFNFTKLKVFLGTLTKSGRQSIITNVTVREMLFEGWKLNKRYAVIPEEERPPEFEGLRFGFFRGKNNSNKGEFVVKTGEANCKNFGQIVSWNGKKRLDWWHEGLKNDLENTCNKINGSDGTIFPPFITKSTVLRLFEEAACRSFALTFASEVTFKGIPAFRFRISKETGESPSVNVYNKCFSPIQHPQLAHYNAQWLSRAFPCKNGSPIVFSQPHFLDGDESEKVSANIESPSPSVDRLKTFVDVEPASGTVLRGAKRLQVNVEVQRLPKLSQFKDLNFSNYSDYPSIILPIFWLEESAELDVETIDELKGKLIEPQKTMTAVKWTLIVAGYMIAFVSGICFIVALKKLQKE